jgi:hypothetical protein
MKKIIYSAGLLLTLLLSLSCNLAEAQNIGSLKKGKRGDADFMQGHYEINKYEAQIVKKIFSWVADEGLTLRAVFLVFIHLYKFNKGHWSTVSLTLT